LALVSLGGVLGSLVRYWLGIELSDGRSATLTANLIGVALATFLLVLMQRRANENLRHFLLPGFCAGLTTFSAVAGLTLEPQEGGQLFLVHNLMFSMLIILLVLPIARKVIAVRP
jgi:CrcB protein